MKSVSTLKVYYGQEEATLEEIEKLMDEALLLPNGEYVEPKPEKKVNFYHHNISLEGT
jgi:hypothetical protein